MTIVLQNIGNEMIQFRTAEPADCRMVWEWANDPDVRLSSFSSEVIPWETHQAWYSRILVDPNNVFLIIMKNCFPVGQVRFKIDNSQAIISISLIKKVRGMGLGAQVINMASRYLLQTRDVDVVHAYIKPENSASIRSFTKAGYFFNQEIEITNCSALDYTFSLESSQKINGN